MKMKAIVFIGFGISVGLISPHIPRAQADSEHHHEHAEHREGPREGEAVLETSESIWRDIHEQHATLSAIVKDGTLDKVHQHAFAIRDLAIKLSEHADVDKKARVEGAVKGIVKLAGDLDESGDEGNQTRTEANLKKFDGMLKVLEAQFERHEH